MPNQTTYIDGLNAFTGGTAGLATAGTAFNLNAKARHLLALLVSAADTVITAAEGSAGQVQITSASLGLADQRFLTGPYITSGPATNSSGQTNVVDIIPFEELLPVKGNEQLTLNAGTAGVTNTTGKSYLIDLMYVQDLPPDYWRKQFPLAVAARGGYQVEAQQLTTAATNLTAISIPSWVQEIIAARAVVSKTGAITAAQMDQAFFNFLSTIPDVAPMKIPTNSDGATLGTPVGTGYYHDYVPFIPIYVRNLGGTQTITPQVNLIAAVSTGNRVAFGVSWR